MFINLFNGEDTGVWVWNGGPTFTLVAYPTYSSGDSLLEICVALADTGIPQGDSIDLIFIATMATTTDWAPDEGSETYTCGVCEQQAPVGGDVFAMDKLAILTPYLLMIFAFLTVTSILIKKRNH